MIKLNKADERVLDILPEGILIFEIESNQILFANECMCSFIGYSAIDFCQFSLFDIHPIEGIKDIILQYLELLSNEKSVLKFLPAVSNKNQIIYFDVTGKMVLYKNKSCFLGSFRNSTHNYATWQKVNSLLKNLSDIKKALDQSAIVAITDSKGIIVDANEKFCALSKYSQDELIGQNHRILNSGFHPKSFFVELWGSISAGKVWHGEICNKTKDGELYWVDTTITPFLGVDGKPEHYISIRYDITSRKRFERQLLTAEKIAKIGSWELKIATGELFWSDEIYEIFKLDPKRFSPSYQTFLDLIHPSDKEVVNKAYSEAVANKKTYEITHRLLLENGEIIYVKEQGITYYEANGNPIRSVGTVQDITELHLAQLNLYQTNIDLERLVAKRTENLLKEKGDRMVADRQKEDAVSNYRMLFEQIPLGVLVLEYEESRDDFILKDVNAAACIIERSAKEKMINSSMLEFYPYSRKTGMLKLLSEVFLTGQSIVTPPRHFKDKISEGWREIFIFKLVTNEVILVYKDITEIVNSSIALKNSLAEKEVLLNEIHHRVKNNLQTVIGLLQMQGAAFKDIPQLAQFVSQSENRVKSMGLIHETIYQTGQHSGINIVAYIKLLYSYLRDAIGKPQIEFKMETEINEIEISNSAALGIVLNEIITNSLKYAFPKNSEGEIFVRIGQVNENLIQIDIRDNGYGIESFPESSKGLGMELIFGLIQQIEGEVKVTTFPSFRYSILIPVVKINIKNS